MRGRCLIVEDNKIYQSLLVEMLQSVGLETATADDGLQALTQLQKQTYDLVLIDGQMPNMNWAEAIRQIRSGGGGNQHRKIVILAMSGDTSMEDQKKFADAGATDHIPKPVSIKDLQYKVNSFLQDAPKILDFSVIEGLQEVAKNSTRKTLVRDLIQLFYLEAPAAFYKMRDALKKLDFPLVDATAHHLRSSCAGLGAQQMQITCDEIQTQSKAAVISADELGRLLGRLETEFSAFEVEVSKTIVSLGP